MKLAVALFLILLASIASTAQRPGPRLIDEFGNVPCDDWLGRLDLFGAELRNNPKSTGLIVLYEGKYFNYQYNRLVLPIFGDVHIRANEIRNHFARRGFPANLSITFMTGGFRDDHLLELWLLPPGADFPKPKPTRESIAYRSGKASSIFPSCP